MRCNEGRRRKIGDGDQCGDSYDEYGPVDVCRRRVVGIDPVVMVRENFVACDVLSQLQRVMDNPRFLLSGECDPVRAGDRVRVYARRGPYVCIYPHDTVSPCKWTHEKALAK